MELVTSWMLRGGSYSLDAPWS